MTRQQTEKMKAYEEKANELVSLTLNVCEERLTQPVEPTALQGDALEGFRLPGLVPAGKNGHRLHTSASSKLILPTTPCWNALPTRCSPTQ